MAIGRLPSLVWGSVRLGRGKTEDWGEGLTVLHVLIASLGHMYICQIIDLSLTSREKNPGRG